MQFGRAADRLLTHFKSAQHYIVYGNQTTTNDCEKRMLRFGTCCWGRFTAGQEVGTCTCGLATTYISKYYPRT
jgi:hypothetical protein